MHNVHVHNIETVVTVVAWQTVYVPAGCDRELC